MKNTVLLSFSALVSGLIFSFGLILSQMVNPARVQGFLDIFGNWDPSLIFVLGGAIPVAFMGVQLMKRMTKPLIGGRFELPKKTKIDRQLIIGSAIFGIGWGLGGFCPAPALASLSYGLEATLYFVTAMIIGMLAHDHVLNRQS